MANYCYNWAVFTGSEDALKRLEKKLHTYKNFDYFTDWGNHILGKDVSSVDDKDFYEYGTRWWDFNVEFQDENNLLVNGDSAWSPPEKLIEEICKHYGLKCRIEFEECGNDFGGYSEYDENGQTEEHYVSYLQWRYEEDSISAIDSMLDDISEGYLTLEDLDFVSDKDKKYMQEQLS